MPSSTREQEIVAYCRGPYCVLSFEAVAVLGARGFKARRLEDGFPNGERRGCPSTSAHARLSQLLRVYAAFLGDKHTLREDGTRVHECILL